MEGWGRTAERDPTKRGGRHASTAATRDHGLVRVVQRPSTSWLPGPPRGVGYQPTLGVPLCDRSVHHVYDAPDGGPRTR